MGLFKTANPNVRVDPTRGDLARRGLVTIMLIALVLVLLAFRSSGIIGGPDEVTAQVDNAGGSLANGADVKFRGVLVGKVKSVQASPTGLVDIELAMKDGQLTHIPRNVLARILPGTVFGTSYVDLLTVGRAATQPIRAGSVIGQDKRTETLELQRALDDIDLLVKAVEPAKLNATLTSLASALDGRGAKIGETIDTLDQLLRQVDPTLPLIKSDLAKLAANLELVQKVAPDALDATRDSLVPLHTIVEERENLQKVLAGATTLTRDGNAFLKKERTDLIRFLCNAAIVTDVVHDHRHDIFSVALTSIIQVADKLGSTVRDGYSQQDVYLQQGIPAYYGAADRPNFGPASAATCGSR